MPAAARHGRWSSSAAGRGSAPPLHSRRMRLHSLAHGTAHTTPHNSTPVHAAQQDGRTRGGGRACRPRKPEKIAPLLIPTAAASDRPPSLRQNSTKIDKIAERPSHKVALWRRGADASPASQPEMARVTQPRRASESQGGPVAAWRRRLTGKSA